MPATIVDLGRRRHYGAFYGLDPVPTGRPLLLLLGNCQAESLRLLLDPAAAEPLDQPAGPTATDPPTDPPADTRGAHSTDPGGAPSAVLRGTHPTRPTSDVVSVRVPPIHELTADDLPYLDALLERADLLVAQPTRADYRDLPLGTEQVLARARADLRTALVSSVRYAGLHPFHVVVHPPELDGVVPPVVAYHDLRAVVLAARGHTDPGADGSRLDDLLDDLPPLTADAVRAVGDDSSAELRRRQQQHGGVAVADLLDDPAVDDMRTVNHPGPRVLTGVARRVRASLGLAPLEVDPGRPLLDDVHAPVHPVVAAVRRPADGPAPSPDRWRVGGRSVAERDVLAAQLAWYADHPAMVREALARHGRTLDHLGLAP
ncbi:WcbI family polysaccharide biosynthesis putative acetyltransferase [Nocardioides sp. P86]|uniref:WcbI family polysaccharide biosynthesis putative acetyltransferase n=1 Tax=Nocardioides sp. P86 TaxID=2939569 RepID=UPI00203CD327|nr:WcbI family polysaccharide biosynthesis putative acetyltransferase [Nocardioides sp. P86]MCM3516610.1 WcbI family polysaccharide biosynthesis putative acetyltransferase [Nocardioides sp. P86]